MTEENMNKVYWIIACLIIVLGITTYVMNPAYAQIKAQSGGINAIKFIAPSFIHMFL